MQAGLYTIHGSLHTDLGEDAVLDVLTDYNGLSRIYNNIEDCEVLVTDLEKQVLQVRALPCLYLAAAIVKNQPSVLKRSVYNAEHGCCLAAPISGWCVCTQTCRWEFLVFSGTFETRLTVHEARQHGEVVFNLISSSFMRQFQGAWKVCTLRISWSSMDTKRQQ